MPGTLPKLLALINEEESSFNMSVGNIINGQSADEDVAKRQFTDYLDATCEVYDVNFVSPGNHDIINDTTRKYFHEMILEKAMQDAVEGTTEISDIFYIQREYSDFLKKLKGLRADIRSAN